MLEANRICATFNDSLPRNNWILLHRSRIASVINLLKTCNEERNTKVGRDKSCPLS